MQSEIADSPVAYEVLRNVHLSDGGSYHVQMELKHGIDQEKAEEVIESMEEEGLLYRVENTEPQLFDVNYGKLDEIWKDLWIVEIADVPVTPVNFGTFIEGYVKSYLEDVEASNIREMMVDEFLTGLNHADLPRDFEELQTHLSEDFDRNHGAHRHVRAGFDFRGQ